MEGRRVGLVIWGIAELGLFSCQSAPLVYAPDNLYPQATVKNVVIYFMRPVSTEAAAVPKRISETTPDGKYIRDVGMLGDGTYFVHQRPAGPASFLITDALSDEGIEISSYFEAGQTYYISYFVRSVLANADRIGMPEFTFDLIDAKAGESTVHQLRMLEAQRMPASF
jgi:hypothetical protein